MIIYFIFYILYTLQILCKLHFVFGELNIVYINRRNLKCINL